MQVVGTAPAAAAVDCAPVTSPPATAVTPLTSAPSIGLVKTAEVQDRDASSTNSVGDVIIWHFRVTNTGTTTVSSVSVDDPLAGAVSCPAGALAPGKEVLCTAAGHVITAADAAAGKVTNVATASARSPGGPVLSKASSVTTLIAAVVTPPSPLPFTGVRATSTLSWALLLLLAGAALLLIGRRRRA